MICPQCGVEYREGYSSCSDCHVLLVRELSAEQARILCPGDPNKDPFRSFWQGKDARLCAEICELLDEAGIHHKVIHREDHLFNFSNQSPYEIGVPGSAYERAEELMKEKLGWGEESSSESETALNEVPNQESGTIASLFRIAKGATKDLVEDLKEFGEEKSSEKSEGLESESEREPENRRDNVPWYEEDATEQVWDGEPPELIEMMRMSLKESDIGFREEAKDDKPKLFVRPDDASRAKEIIQEILDSTMPE